MGDQLDDEVNIYKRIEAGPKRHTGRRAVRSLLDSFEVDGPDGQHRCLVHPPLWESMLDLLHRNPIRKFPPVIVAVILLRTFQALDYLHTHCQIIHTGMYTMLVTSSTFQGWSLEPAKTLFHLDIKANNIMFGSEDNSVFTAFEEAEFQTPSPRKEEVDGRIIYASRQVALPKNKTPPMLCDFGSAVLGNEPHTENAQPNIYRAPEVILDIPWSYSIDIWNVGCMVS